MPVHSFEQGLTAWSGKKKKSEDINLILVYFDFS